MSTRWDAVWSAASGWQRVALAALVIATAAQTLFVLIYGTRPWWRARVGRALFLKSAVLCLLLWLTIVNTFVTYPGEEPVAAIALIATAAAIVYQLVALVLSPRSPNV